MMLKMLKNFSCKFNGLKSLSIYLLISLALSVTIFVSSSWSIEGERKWFFRLNQQLDTNNYGSGCGPAIGSDGTIYVGSDNNYGDEYLYAVNPDGNMKWSYKFGGGFSFSSPALGADGTIYIGAWVEKKVYAFTPDGNVKWTCDIGDAILSSPAIGADGTIYIGSWNNRLNAITPDGKLKWFFSTTDRVNSPAIGADGTIYVGSDDSKFYAINPDGSLKWLYQLQLPNIIIFPSPAIGADGTIYVGSHDKNLYAFTPNGEVKWIFPTGGVIVSSAAIGVDGTIYFGSGDKNLYAITPDGKLKWSYLTGDVINSSPAIGADGVIYVGSFDKRLYAITPDGKLKWFYQTTDGTNSIGSPPAIASDGTVYFESSEGILYAIDSSSKGLADSPWPMFHHDAKHTGRSTSNVATNLASQYKSGKVTPTSGASGSNFTFECTWQDPENDYVVDVKAQYRKQGTTTWTELPDTLDPVSGVMPPTFKSKDIPITGEAGTYEYQFQARDAKTADSTAARLHPGVWTDGGTFTITGTSDTALISVSPNPYDFGNVNIGQQASQTFTISNTGKVNLNITNIILSDTTVFLMNVNNGTGSCGSTSPSILPGNNCTIALAFNPKTPGKVNQTLTINSNASNTPNLQVALSGTGISTEPSVTLIPSKESGEAPLNVGLTAQTANIAVSEYQWDFDNDGKADETTLDNWVSLTLIKEGDYPIKVTVVALNGTKYEKQIVIKVLVGQQVNENITFVPYHPASDSTPSEIMKGGKAVRYYKVLNDKQEPVIGKKIYFVYQVNGVRSSDTQSFLTTDTKGFVKVDSPAVISSGDYALLVTDENYGDNNLIQVKNPPSFHVNVKDREFSESYKLLLGLGGQIGVGGPGIKIGPLKAKSAELALKGGKNASTQISINTKGEVSDVEIENIYDEEAGVSGEVGTLGAGWGKKIRPILNASAVSAGVTVNHALSTQYSFPNFMDDSQADHERQLTTSAASFFEFVYYLKKISGNADNMNAIAANIMMDYLLTDILNRVTGFSDYKKGIGSTIGGVIDYSVGPDFKFGVKNPIGISKGSEIGINLSFALDGEYAYERTDEEDVSGTKRSSQTITYSMDWGGADFFINKKFGGDKRKSDTPEASLEPFKWNGVNIKEGEESVTIESAADGKKTLTYERFSDRKGGDFYYIGSSVEETFLSLKTDDPEVIDDISGYAKLVRDMLQGVDVTINSPAYNDVWTGFINSSKRKDWERTKKEKKIISIPLDFEVAFGKKLGLNINLDMMYSLEYMHSEGYLNENELLQTAMYEKDEYIKPKGLTSVISEYTQALNKMIQEIVKTVDKAVEAGKEAIVYTAESIVEGGAYLKAKANQLANGARLFISSIPSAFKDRSYRISVRGDSGSGTATTIGNVFVVNVTDENGNALTAFSPPLEIGIGYTDAALQKAGFSISDASKLKAYRWDGQSGYYVFVGGTADTVNKVVTCEITLPGQYILAIDQMAPQILNFKASDGTPKPTITFNINDNLSGVNVTNLSIRLDDTEIVNNANYVNYLDIRTETFSYPVQTPLSKGQHTVKISVSDTAGNVETHSFDFMVNDVLPSITHTPITQAVSGSPVQIGATASDDEGIKGVLLHYRAKTDEMPYKVVQMLKGSDSYTEAIPKEFITSFGVRYYLTSVDNSGNQKSSDLIDIQVDDKTGPEITGNFTITSQTGEFTVRWNSPADVDVAGYRVYLGDTPTSLTLYEDIKSLTSWTTLNSSNKGRYISVSAYDYAGNEGKRLNPTQVRDTSCKAVFTFNSDGLTAYFNTAGSIGELSFNYGDGISGTAATHTYANSGTYQVTLTAKDTANNCTDTVTNAVIVNSPVITTDWTSYADSAAAFTVQPITGNAPLTVSFDTQGTIGEISFNYGDGTTGKALSHTYTQPGTYKVVLTATGISGYKTLMEKTVTVTQAPCVAAANFTAQPENGQAPLSVSLNTDGSTGELSFDYGDGTTGKELSHTYSQSGTYTIILTAAGVGGCKNTMQKTITVTAVQCVATAKIKATPVSGTVPFTVSFDASESQGQTYEWNFGDGSTAIGQIQSHTYTNPGTYAVVLTVKGTDGCADSANIMITALAADIPPNMPTITMTSEREFQAGNLKETPAKLIWEIFTDTITLFRTETSGLSLKLPELFLNKDTNYQCRIMSVDSKSNLSAWSEPLAFKVSTSDAGIQTGALKFEMVNQNDTLLSLKYFDSQVFSDVGKPAYLPSGLAGFKLKTSPGGIAQAVIRFSEAVAADAKWYRYDEMSSRYEEYAHAVFAQDRKSVTLEIRDGGFGDADGVENGVIVSSPSGYGTSTKTNTDTVVQPVQSDDGGGGCFINSLF